MRAMKSDAHTISGRQSLSKGEASKQAILSAAILVAGRDGLPSASLGAIAREAGTSKPAVLYHFGSRENLLRAMAERALTGFAASVIEASVDDDPLVGSRSGMDIVFTPAYRTEAAAVRELMSLGMRDPAVGEMVLKSFGAVERAAALLIQHAVDDPDEVAADMVKAIHGFLQIWLCSGEPDPTAFKDGAMRTIAALLASKQRA